MLASVLNWWSGIWALLERALRIDARQLSQHLFRLAAVVLVYLAVVFSEWSGMSFGAPGLRYFQQLAYLNLGFIALAGVGYFAAAITEEKEEDTLGLMLMAGISPFGILLGKAGGRLFQAAILLTVQFPFTLLAVTLGGVTRGQVLHTYISLIAFLFCLSNVALLCSVICRRTRDAAALTFFWQALYFLLPVIALEFQRELISRGLTTGWRGVWLRFLGGVGKCSVWQQLEETLLSGAVPTMFNLQVVSNLLGGLAAFLLARLLFTWGTRDLATDATPRSLIAVRSGRGRGLTAGRVRGNAFAWKDFHFTCGGWPVVVIKVLCHAALFGFIMYQMHDPGRPFIYWRDTAGVYFGIGLFLTLLDAAWSFGRIYHEELKLQTWPTLVMLPRSLPELIYTKAFGVVLSLLPSLLCLSLVFLTGCLSWKEVVIDSLQHSEVWVVYGMAFALIHLTTLYSVLVKWGALPLAFATLIGLIFAWEMLLSAGIRFSYWEYRHQINAAATLLLLFGCVLCHFLIALRLRAMAAH